MPSYLPTSELPDKQWQRPFFLTIAVHVCLLLFGYFAPSLLHFQRKIPEVYTVNLFSVQDLGGPPPAAPRQAAVAPQAEPTPPKTAPEPIKQTPPQKTQPTPEPEVAKDAISLKPIKTKEKTDIDKVKKLRDKILAENNERIAKEAAEKAKADADKKAKGAVDSLKQALMASQQLAAAKGAAGGSATSATQGGSGTGSGTGGSGIMVDENLRRYLLAVNNQIHEHWALPDLQSWKQNVEAIVIIRVRRDGVIVESSFKKKSDNIFFNQFVEKTLKLSSPLPPFPIGINQSEMEIGLKFRPGEIL